MGVLTALPHWHLPNKLGTIGRQAYNVDVTVIDADGQRVAPGQIGEIVSRGENVMLGYYDEPEQTAAIWRHGWAHTGDVGTIDEEGFITLVDRSKDMIISGGENVYPKEIENVLYEHSAVAECAVFGVPDDKWGEVPTAYVQVKAGTRVSERELVEYCAERLARFKRPRNVKFVSEFPKTPIGKIQKNVLRAKYWMNREKKI
jgi:acyl-CoA synthetase (AMP-forming)/AMP-acid ligase II